MIRLRAAISIAMVAAAGCLATDGAPPTLRKLPRLLPEGRETYIVPLPAGFPLPAVPAENALTQAKVDLGRYLFYDRRLSRNETYSCASCHQQQHAFTDGRVRAIGSTGSAHPRNTMTLANAVYAPAYTWANPSVRTLEDQLVVPLTNQHPVEMGFGGELEALVRRLRNDSRYRQLFAGAFPGEIDPVTMTNVGRAIASFERTIVSGRSPYDRLVHGGNPEALRPAAIRGMKLFFSDRLQCASCHEGFDFCGPVRTAEEPAVVSASFRNTGTVDPRSEDLGLWQVTKRAEDIGRFRVPTLRNVAVTAPYMHDGSMATLEEVIDHYAAGGPPREGQVVEVRALRISAEERRDVIEFLRSLTDEELLKDARLSDPW